jgi:hypothetical protein
MAKHESTSMRKVLDIARSGYFVDYHYDFVLLFLSIRLRLTQLQACL